MNTVLRCFFPWQIQSESSNLTAFSEISRGARQRDFIIIIIIILTVATGFHLSLPAVSQAPSDFSLGVIRLELLDYGSDLR